MKVLLKFWHGIGKAIDWCCNFAHLMGEIVNALLLLIITYEVVARYVFNNPPIWAEEISCYLFIFMVWIPLGGILKGNHNIALDIVINKISPKNKNRVELINLFVGLLFCFILAWYGVKYSFFQYSFDFRSSTLLAVPLWIPYLIIPFGAFLISLQYVVKITKNIYSLSAKKQGSI